ncbi:MAG: hypothetical protein MAG794_00114 [Gammaproteobacteria bacterium]|nr:hypothetical protein [Gammaproteobacteria bacterium]
MPNVVEKIHQDHVSISKVLDLIEEEIRHARNEQNPELELLEDAMRYMINYADLIHHPTEDSMFTRLIQVDPEVADQVETLRQEHLKLAVLSTAFLDIVKAAESGEFVLRDEMVKRGTEYVDTLRSHMGAEEENLLRRAKASLTEKDLGRVDAEHSSAHDPLREESLKQEYARLYRSLFT